MEFNEYSDDFKKGNKVILELASTIENYLKYMGDISVPIIVNANSLNIKLRKDQKRNSTMLVLPKGFAKSTLLKALAQSNPKFFQQLDSKVFESDLVKKPKEYFHRKIVYHDDIITMLHGLAKKQRQQLAGFFIKLLTDKEYTRENNKQLRDVDCVAIFGMAEENFEVYHKELFDSTLLDRFCILRKDITTKDKEDILVHRNVLKEGEIQIPSIKLPIHKKEVSVKLKLTEEMKRRINELAMKLDARGAMSCTRAQDYIEIFMMSNALLNGRTEITLSDLELYEYVDKFHVGAEKYLPKSEQIERSLTLEPFLKDKERIEKLGIPRRTYYRQKRKLK